MKTIEMEVAIMKACNIRQNLVVPNVSWGLWVDHRNGGALHECDILSLSNRGYATEIEIKVSKSDLLKDGHKKHSHEHNLIARLYFAVPEKLKDIALGCIPERAGLYVVKDVVYNKNYTRRVVSEVKSPKRNKQAMAWDDKQRYQLARLGAIRILGLKSKIISLMFKNSDTKAI